jgi:hypothetical protein
MTSTTAADSMISRPSGTGRARLRLDELADAPAAVTTWLDHTNYSMGLDDLAWVRAWVQRAARDLEALEQAEVSA